MTTRQTIASPKPANINISSPIPKNLSHANLTHSRKISLAKSDTFSQKSLASRSKSPVPTKSAIQSAHATTETSATSTTSATSATSATNSKQRQQEARRLGKAYVTFLHLYSC